MTGKETEKRTQDSEGAGCKHQDSSVQFNGWWVCPTCGYEFKEFHPGRAPTPPPQPEDVVERLEEWFKDNADMGQEGADERPIRDALTLIQSQRKDYNEACEAVRHLEARVREWRESSDALQSRLDAANEVLRKISKVRPNQLAALVIKEMQNLARTHLGEDT